MIGKARQFNFMLDFFNNPQYLKFMNYTQKDSINFYFDIYGEKLKNLKKIDSRGDENYHL